MSGKNKSKARLIEHLLSIIDSKKAENKFEDNEKSFNVDPQKWSYVTLITIQIVFKLTKNVSLQKLILISLAQTGII